MNISRLFVYLMSLRDTKQTADAVIYMPKRMRETQAAKHEGGAGLADLVMTSRPMSTSAYAHLFPRINLFLSGPSSMHFYRYIRIFSNIAVDYSIWCIV